MSMTATLSRYIAALYLKNTLFLLAALLAVIYLFDTVELIRRGSKITDLPLSLIFKMSLLKLPEVGQILFPFAILFGALLTFWQLNRRHELIIARSAGFSVWQIIAPVIITALTIGILQITAINPIGALLIGKFEQLESKYLDQQNNQIAVFKEGLWLRQNLNTTQNTKSGYVILYAEKITQPDWALKSVNVLYFDEQDTFLQRIDAKTATLEPGKWLFENVTINTPDNTQTLKENRYTLSTTLTLQDVEDSFASPATMSFWHLPAYIKTLEETGFNASNLRVHYQNLLSQPLLFIAMVLLAASVSMRPPRLRGGLILFSSGIFMGFVVFFLSSFLQALGASQQIPVLLAAWSPALICFMFGISIVINLEDG